MKNDIGLRDMFAMLAMLAIINQNKELWSDEVASRAYMVADAMMEERELSDG
jgi:hypothetical protein